MPTMPRAPRLALTAIAATTLAAVLLPSAAQADNAAPRLPTPHERDVGMLLDELGMPWGTVVNSWDVTEAAALLDVEVDTPPVLHGVARNFGLDPMDVWRDTYVRVAEDELMQGFRNRASEVLDALDIDYGSSVDDSDLERLASTLGINIGARIDPADVSQLLDAGRRAARIGTEKFAEVGGLRLHLPAHRVAGIGFHEAPRGGERRLAMTNLDERSFTMPSRGRGTHPTSAVDVAVPSGVEILAPVSGIVEDVTVYDLYGKYRDAHLTIRPTGHRNRGVRILHVTGVQVSVGQRVEGGVTTIATGANQFPFDSQIDGMVGRHPHVDISVRPR